MGVLDVSIYGPVFKNHPDIMRIIYEESFVEGDVKVCKWVKAQGINILDSEIGVNNINKNVYKNNDRIFIDYVIENNFFGLTFLIYCSIVAGNFELTRYIREKGVQGDPSILLNIVVCEKRNTEQKLQLIKYLINKGYQLEAEESCIYYALMGDNNNEMLDYLMDEGCNCDLSISDTSSFDPYRIDKFKIENIAKLNIDWMVTNCINYNDLLLEYYCKQGNIENFIKILNQGIMSTDSYLISFILLCNNLAALRIFLNRHENCDCENTCGADCIYSKDSVDDILYTLSRCDIDKEIYEYLLTNHAEKCKTNNCFFVKIFSVTEFSAYEKYDIVKFYLFNIPRLDHYIKLCKELDELGAKNPENLKCLYDIFIKKHMLPK